MDDFDRAQKLCEKYKAWKDEIAKKCLSFDPVDAFMAGYELGQNEKTICDHSNIERLEAEGIDEYGDYWEWCKDCGAVRFVETFYPEDGPEEKREEWRSTK